MQIPARARVANDRVPIRSGLASCRTQELDAAPQWAWHVRLHINTGNRSERLSGPSPAAAGGAAGAGTSGSGVLQLRNSLAAQAEPRASGGNAKAANGTVSVGVEQWGVCALRQGPCDRRPALPADPNCSFVEGPAAESPLADASAQELAALAARPPDQTAPRSVLARTLNATGQARVTLLSLKRAVRGPRQEESVQGPEFRPN